MVRIISAPITLSTTDFIIILELTFPSFLLDSFDEFLPPLERSVMFIARKIN